MRTLKIVLILLAVLALAGSGWYYATRENRAFKADAGEAIVSLYRIESAVEVGLNVGDYGGYVRDAHFAIKQFKKKYENRFAGQDTKNRNEKSRRELFAAILDAESEYVKAASAWDQKIKSDWEDPSYERSMQESWSSASDSIRHAETLLPKISWW